MAERVGVTKTCVSGPPVMREYGLAVPEAKARTLMSALAGATLPSRRTPMARNARAPISCTPLMVGAVGAVDRKPQKSPN